MENKARESLETIRQGRDAASTAFMMFTDYKQYHKEYAFAFYEGEDGKYYNQRIKNIIGPNLIHIKAKNKKNVLQVMKMIQSKHEYDSVITMFYVDRDMGFFMEEYDNEDLFVTPCYSIENLYAQKEVLGLVLEDEFGLNTCDEDYIKFMALFEERYKSFEELITEFNALVLLRYEKGLDCGKISIQHIKTSQLIRFDLAYQIAQSAHYQKEIDTLKTRLCVTDEDIADATTRLLAHGEPSFIFRGKNQLDFLVNFIVQLSAKRNELFKNPPQSVNINPNQNALGELSRYAQTPPELTEFINKHNFIRAYSMT